MTEQAVNNPVDLDMLDAMAVQLKRDTWDMVLRFAHGQCRMLAAAGADVDSGLAGQLVDDVVSDTAFGTLAWDPSLCKLSTHLCQSVRHRAWKLLLKHRRSPHESMTRGDLKSDAVMQDASLARMGEDAADELSRRRAAADFKAALWSLARDAGDEVVQLLLTAYEDEVYARKDVIEYTDMSVDEYRAAVKRMRRMAAQLPEELRHAARDAMRGVA